MKDQIYNWLTIAIQQPRYRFSEIFYYDKATNEFFSVLVTDYFLFESDLTLAKNTTSGYSQATLKTLQDRIQRIDRNDTQIISLPRHGDLENKNSILEIINTFLNEHRINMANATIWDVESSGDITIELSDQ